MHTSNSQPQIESKNLMIIEDQLKHEALAVKKTETYVEYFQDAQLKQTTQQIAQHHRQNFNNLLNYLETHQ